MSRPQRPPPTNCRPRSTRSAGSSAGRTTWWIAVSEADATNESDRLRWPAAQKIGDVVKLIRTSPDRPTCSRSTPPSRRRAPARPGGLRGRRLRGEIAGGADREGDRGDRRQIAGVQASTAAAVEAIAGSPTACRRSTTTPRRSPPRCSSRTPPPANLAQRGERRRGPKDRHRARRGRGRRERSARLGRDGAAASEAVATAAANLRGEVESFLHKVAG